MSTDLLAFISVDMGSFAKKTKKQKNTVNHIPYQKWATISFVSMTVDLEETSEIFSL